MKLSPNRKPGTLFAADVQQLQETLAKGGRGPIVLTGQLVLSSLATSDAVDGYVPLAARQISRELLTRKNTGKALSVWLQKEAATLLARSSAKVSLAVDALLKYGQKHKSIEDLLVLSTAAGTERSVVVALRFKKGLLESVRDYELASPKAHTLDADLHTVIERCKLQFPSAVMHWAGPSASPKGFDFVQIPESVWAQAPVQALSAGSGVRFLQQHGLPLLVVALSAAGYAGAMYLPYERYSLAAQSIAQESASLKGEYAFASDRLALLRAQRNFLEKGASAPERLRLLESVLSALKEVKDVKVVDVKLLMEGKDESGKSAAQMGTDVEVTIEVPVEKETTALEQSIPLLNGLRDSLGLSLRLAPDGMREGTGGEKAKTRSYKIIGAMPRA